MPTEAPVAPLVLPVAPPAPAPAPAPVSTPVPVPAPTPFTVSTAFLDPIISQRVTPALSYPSLPLISSYGKPLNENSQIMLPQAIETEMLSSLIRKVVATTKQTDSKYRPNVTNNYYVESGNANMPQLQRYLTSSYAHPPQFIQQPRILQRGNTVDQPINFFTPPQQQFFVGDGQQRETQFVYCFP